MHSSIESGELKANAKETYWPILESSLLNGDLCVEDLDLDCPICYENMSVRTTDGPVDEHLALILPCGHIFGESCVCTGEFKSCPICRAEVVHTRCGLPFGGKPVPGDIKQIDSIPRVLSKGGYISPNCLNCRLQKELDALMEEFIEIDEVSQTRNNLPPRKLGMSIKLGCLQWDNGDCPDGMKAVAVKNPEYIEDKFNAFREKLLRLENGGDMWFNVSIGAAKLQCFTFQPSKLKAIMDIYHHLEAYGDLDDDEDDEEDDLDEIVAGWQILCS